MAAQAGCGITVLPVEVLSKVLQHVDLRDLLLSCSRVCSLWRKAAAMSITAIGVPKCKEYEAASLSIWLQAHAAEAKLDSISVTMHYSAGNNNVSLPLEHLTSLRNLRFKNVRFATAHTAAADAGAEVESDEDSQWGAPQELLTPALSGLTRLDLLCCQELELQLTYTDIRSLTKAAFPELPCTLTRLKFSVDSKAKGQPGHGPDFHFSPSSTPGLCQLTALQELELSGCLKRRYLVHVGVLTALLALRKLSLACSCELSAGIGEPTLSVLTALTQLEHLRLPSCDDGVLVSPADYAAATASQQLTYLDIRSFARPEQVNNIFPDHLRLPSLQFLEVDILWLEDAEVMESVITCCPGLQQLNIFSGGAHDIADVEAQSWAASLESLTGLSCLTSLSMLTLDVAMSREVYKAIAALTGLRELSFEGLDAVDLWPAVQLTACRQLTSLHLGVLSGVDFEGDLSVYATNKAPVGSPPDVWRQIPALILQSATDNFDAFENDRQALHSLLRAAAQASSHALQREAELEQTVQGMQQQLAASMQQVAQLQASMAAVLQRLQLPGPIGGGTA